MSKDDYSNFIEDLFTELGGEARVSYGTASKQDFGNYIEWPYLDDYSDDELEWVVQELNIELSDDKDELIERIRDTGEVPEGTCYERDDESVFPEESKDPRMHPDE